MKSMLLAVAIVAITLVGCAGGPQPYKVQTKWEGPQPPTVEKPQPQTIIVIVTNQAPTVVNQLPASVLQVSGPPPMQRGSDPRTLYIPCEQNPNCPQRVGQVQSVQPVHDIKTGGFTWLKRGYRLPGDSIPVDQVPAPATFHQLDVSFPDVGYEHHDLQTGSVNASTDWDSYGGYHDHISVNNTSSHDLTVTPVARGLANGNVILVPAPAPTFNGWRGGGGVYRGTVQTHPVQ
jgi:hypothetical protein